MTKDKRPWQPTTVAAAALNCSARHLKNMRTDGTLKRGKHWRDIRRSGAARPTYQWHIANIEKLLELGADRRG